MSTHDMIISNDTGAAVRADINLALAALAGSSISATAPATTYAGQFWADTTAVLLKQRNSANSGWITIGVLDATNLGLLALAGGTMTGSLVIQALLSLDHASGGQIKFPATQNASSNANTLDDYEEGTWTPALQFATDPAGITYSEASGSYTKIGNTVFARGSFTLSSKGSNTGSARIAGLPFTPAAGDKGASIGYMVGITYANFLMLLIQAAPSIDFYEITEGGVTTELTDADFTNTSRIGFSCFFQV